MAGSYDSPPYYNLRCFGVGVVLKKDGGWKLINHLSAPTDNSINDFIDPGDISLQYATMDDAIKICHTLGQGALMAKEDWHLLGIHWHDKYFVDKCLPFGLRSAPYLFNMVADALEWILRHYSVTSFTTSMTSSLQHLPHHQVVSMLSSICSSSAEPWVPQSNLRSPWSIHHPHYSGHRTGHEAGTPPTREVDSLVGGTVTVFMPLTTGALNGSSYPL